MSYDDIEIKKAEIHEAAETKRKQIEEREATKRHKTWSDDLKMGVAIVCGLAFLVGSVAGGISYSHYLEARYPTIARCREFDPSASSTPSVCDPGGHLVIDEHGKRCVCDRQPATVTPPTSASSIPQ